MTAALEAPLAVPDGYRAVGPELVVPEGLWLPEDPGPEFGCQLPRVGWVPAGDGSDDAAVEVLELAEHAGREIDPWAEFVLRAGLQESRPGQWLTRHNMVAVSRQNGKDWQVIDALALAGLFLWELQKVMVTAHVFDTAKEAFDRLRDLIENCPDLDRKVNNYRTSNGAVQIELTRAAGGGRCEFRARSASDTGRGKTGQLNLLNEGQDLRQGHLRAILPTMVAQGGRAQAWMLGSAPKLDAPGSTGDAWRAQYARRHKREPRFMLAAWSRAPWRPVGDREGWREANPGLGFRELTFESLGDELAGLGTDGFRVEHLGDWPPEQAGGGGVFDGEAWVRCGGRVQHGSPLVFGVGVTEDAAGVMSAVCAASRGADGKIHLDFVDRRPGREWLPGRRQELGEHGESMWVTGGKAVEAVLPELGVTRHVPVGRLAAVAGRLVEQVSSGQLVHTRQVELTEAQAAAERTSGGEWVGGGSAVLQAMGLAVWGAAHLSVSQQTWLG